MKLLNPLHYDIDPVTGFLPSRDPLLKLPSRYDAWEQCVAELPAYLISGHVRHYISQLPLIDVSVMDNADELDRAMLILSYLGHAYVWGETPIATQLPKNIALPWYLVAKKMGRPPVLSYASYALYNWRRFDTQQPIALGNVAMLQRFWGGIDEDWFILIHIAIEAQAAPAMYAIPAAFAAVEKKSNHELAQQLNIIATTLANMQHMLERMVENCDPYIYYNRVRRFIYGWLNNPAFPNGVVYEGVDEWQGQGQQFRGESGAQSSIIPSLDAALGLSFDRESPLFQHLLALRAYMPPKHRQFIEDVESLEKQYSIREYIREHKTPDLVEAYNACIDGIHHFRATHLGYAANYINKQAEKPGSPVATGTGGTPFMSYLGAHVQDVLNSRL